MVVRFFPPSMCSGLMFNDWNSCDNGWFNYFLFNGYFLFYFYVFAQVYISVRVFKTGMLDLCILLHLFQRYYICLLWRKIRQTYSYLYFIQVSVIAWYNKNESMPERSIYLFVNYKTITTCMDCRTHQTHILIAPIKIMDTCCLLYMATWQKICLDIEGGATYP